MAFSSKTVSNRCNPSTVFGWRRDSKQSLSLSSDLLSLQHLTASRKHATAWAFSSLEFLQASFNFCKCSPQQTQVLELVGQI